MSAGTSGLSALTCRNCGAGLSPEPGARGDPIIVCQHCGSVHERDRAARSAEASTDAAAVEPRRLAPPARFKVEHPDGGLRVSWRKGRRAGAIMLGLFSLIWLGAAGVSGFWPLLLIGPVLGYYALVRGINRLTLHADATAIVLRQGPLPWPGAMRLARADVVQLFSTMKVTRVRDGSDGRERVRTRRSYRVRARLQDGRRVNLVGGLSSADQALWLEREVERATGIADVPVEGEIRR